MENETTRRSFLSGGGLATAALLAGTRAEGARQDPGDHGTHGREGHGEAGGYARDRPSVGGPVGSATDRGKQVPGLREAGQPPVPVITPDLPEKLAWTMVDGAKEFHLHCGHTR